MKKNLRYWAAAAVGAAAALAFTSCAYDPYYAGGAGGSYGSDYSSGYGDGYGYGGSNFSTSYFVATGDPQWGYDPYSYSYYDYQRRSYYDPYLNGYYPIGYRPPIIIGAPHPYGWRPGHGYCPPPRRVHHGVIANYRNRESSYRGSGYAWARQVRQQPVTRSRDQGPRTDRNRSQEGTRGPRPSANDSRDRRLDAGSRSDPRSPSGRDPRRGYASPSPGLPPEAPRTYTRTSPFSNRLAADPGPRQTTSRQQPVQRQIQPRQMQRPEPQRSVVPGSSRGGQPMQRSRGPGDAAPTKESKPSKEEKRGLRSLGQG